MDITVNKKGDNGKASEIGGIDLYRESIKKTLYSAMGTALDDETRQATKEMTEEREKAIKQIAEEKRTVINKIVEDEKKAIWARAQETSQSEDFNSETIRESIAQTYIFQGPVESGKNGDTLVPDTNHNGDVHEEKVELEILPPRDQNEIAMINTYLINMPEVMKVELVTLVDKSIFKVKLNEPVNFIEKLGSLPQILTAEEVVENGQKKIKIVLLAKSKLERNQNEVNEKVNKIFSKKKQY
jgi:hypothetical protein